MTSEKQTEANQANSRKSTGPKTQDGKNRSRLNARRHGLTGQITVMTEEERIASEAFTLQIVESLNPKTAAERQLAQAYATAHWRINRAAALEEGLFTLSLAEDQILSHLQLDQPEVHTALNNAATFRDDPKAFDLLSLYTTRLISQSEKLLKQLKQLQSERQAEELRQMESAMALYNLHTMDEIPFDPRESGFVFSLDEIRTQVHRQNLAKRAADACKVGYDRETYRDIFKNPPRTN